MLISNYKPCPSQPSSDIRRGIVSTDIGWIDQPTSWYRPLDRLVGLSSIHVY